MTSVNGTARRPRNLLKLSTDEKRQFLDSFDHIFSDIDGVVWNLDHNIEGAAEGYNALKDAGKKLTFLTNNSVRPIRSCLKKLKALNIDVELEDIIHPAKSVVDYLKGINFEGLIYIIASESFKNELKEAGFSLIDGPTKVFEESYLELASFIFDGKPVRAVIIDFDFNMSSAKLMRAHVYLQKPDCLLIAGATDMLMPVRKDISIIGPGHFATLIAEASKRPMIVMGKPGRDLADMLIKRYEIKDTSRALMIGDMLEQDVGFGKECNFQTLAVLSGGCSLDDLETQTNPQLIPDYYAESMADFVEFMNDIVKSNV